MNLQLVVGQVLAELLCHALEVFERDLALPGVRSSRTITLAHRIVVVKQAERLENLLLRVALALAP